MALHAGMPTCAPDQLVDGRYRLLEMISRGGSACVWRAEDERLCRVVAMKVLDHHADQRGWDEARVLAQLSHPHIATLYDYGIDHGRPYLVLELVEGSSLAELTPRTMPPTAAIAACAQAAQALAWAHSRGLVHRDVKPANIMITSTGVKIIDFGISALSGGPEVDGDGQLHGTPAYTAPERLTASAVGAPSDVYSLGIVLYRLLAGRMPWPEAITPSQLFAMRRRREPDPLPPLAAVPAQVVDTCMRCLASDPAQRPTAVEVARLLRDAAPAHDLAQVAETLADWCTPVLPPPAQHPDLVAAGPPPPRAAAKGVAVVGGLTALIWAVATPLTGWGPDDQPGRPAIAEPPGPSRSVHSCTANMVTDLDPRSGCRAAQADPRRAPRPVPDADTGRDDRAQGGARGSSKVEGSRSDTSPPGAGHPVGRRLATSTTAERRTWTADQRRLLGTTGPSG
ncbi:MAG TPA: protein kinase [Micromonosporaceae bacterium]